MEIKIPKLGVAMTEGTLVEWLVADRNGRKVFDLNSEKGGLLREYGDRGNFGN